MSDDLLANEGASQPFDKIKTVGNFVGSVDGHVDDGVFPQGGQRYSDLDRKFSRFFGGRYAMNAKTRLHAHSEFSNKVGCCRAGPETDDHAVFDSLKCSN